MRGIGLCSRLHYRGNADLSAYQVVARLQQFRITVRRNPSGLLSYHFRYHFFISQVSYRLYSGTILLGFVDDMLDLQWRYKLMYPFFIVIPMVCNYYGPTSVIFTYPVNLIIESIDFGPILFSTYIILLGIYCTNTINIYAGINGLEVGQSIIAAASLLIIFGVKSFRE
jgi:UDP-N-acetylmuramyl pentapeptide phosphotransferase/UDP-N-acetylglucosamine-1-phosphate transferase